jgi:hypothetical protein
MTFAIERGNKPKESELKSACQYVDYQKSFWWGKNSGA